MISGSEEGEGLSGDIVTKKPDCGFSLLFIRECYICQQYEQIVRLCIKNQAFDLLYKTLWCMNTHYYYGHFLKRLGLFYDMIYSCL
jgi:hypothetical protein